MKILIISNMYPSKQKPFSGLFVINQLNAIQKELSTKDKLDFYYLKRTFTGPIGSVIKYLKFFFGFFFFIVKSKVKFNIIHIHYYFPTVYLGLVYRFFFNKKAKIVVTFHGGDFYNKKKGIVYKYPLSKVDKVIAVSVDLCKSLEKMYISSNIEVIPAGINTVFKPPILKINKKYDLIYVGSFYKVKGFDILCDFLSTYTFPLRVCVIGSGQLENCLEKVKGNENVQIELFRNLNHIEIVEKLYTSKFLINTSRKESFGLSMTEAMACGVPVIATKTDGSMEQITPNFNGFFINDYSPKILASRIERFLNIHYLMYQNMSKNAIQSSSRYKLPIIASKVIEQYQILVN